MRACQLSSDGTDQCGGSGQSQAPSPASPLGRCFPRELRVPLDISICTAQEDSTPHLQGFKHRGSITESILNLPRLGTARPSHAPPGKLAPPGSPVQKYPQSLRGCCCQAGEQGWRYLLAEICRLARRWGGWEGRLGSAEPSALSKIAAEQMVGARCWWWRQPRLFPRQLVAASCSSINPLPQSWRLLAEGGREVNICLSGRPGAQRCFIGFWCVLRWGFSTAELWVSCEGGRARGDSIGVSWSDIRTGQGVGWHQFPKGLCPETVGQVLG